MARKKYQEEPESHERWLVSYADFITLLFAFFVVMYALSTVNVGKYNLLSTSISSAFGNARPPPVTNDELHAILPLRPLQPGMNPRASDALRQEKQYMTKMAKSLMDALAPLVREGKVRVIQNSRGVSVEINASVLFAPGEANLAPESYEALKAIASLLREDRHMIQVEGHTDNVPISNTVFPSNWELSSVRASSVIRLFIDSGLAEKRLSIVGHGPNQPVGSNDTAEGRARNRRVAVLILSALPDPVKELPTGKK